MKRLDKTTVSAIKHDLASGTLSQPAIAERHKVSRSTVSDIATGRVHKDVPWPTDPPVKRAGGQRKAKEDYDPTNDRIRELESEVVHLREERDRERARVKAGAKTEGLFRAMAAVLTENVAPVTPLPPAILPARRKGEIEEHCVMHISDGHHDEIVTPEECGGLERYDFRISCCRAERYVDTVVQWTQGTLGSAGFRFPVLNVLAYGDHTSGEIHGHVSRSYYRNQFRNCLAIGKLHALMYRDLAPYFKQVNVVYVPGNHGRRSLTKDHHGARNNWDYLLAEIAKLHCQSIPNIDFLIPDCFSVNLNINGVGFNVSHGDDIRSNGGMPWYGLQRRHRRLAGIAHLMQGLRPRYYCVGHFHNPATIGEVDGELMVNGPWVATDAYAFNELGAYSEPRQWLHGVNSKYGITWRMAVALKDAEAEKRGPRRYIIDPGQHTEED
jgi:hypothetical protein